MAKKLLPAEAQPAKAEFVLAGRSPDVLTCIANLSNDEVFTPPELARRMLDDVAVAWAEANGGKNIWSDQTVRFLDPFTKSGVFLREIASKLVEGLKDEIPDIQERVNHILTKQVFGIPITQLTAYIARRSLYCSKFANGPHSIVSIFNKGDGYGKSDGQIWFERIEHTWEGGTEWKYVVDPSTRKRIRISTNGRCRYCGAAQATLDRGNERESHAYAFIHTDNIQGRLGELFGKDMKFDVIVGNPPYQLSDGGFAASATPIYHKFIEQAIDLEPKFLVMITPSRWFVGGRGLGAFRKRMLADKHIRAITDFIVEKDAFPGVNINGGVNFFLYDRTWNGDCSVRTVAAGGAWGRPVERALDEFDVFVRRNEAVSILRKVRSKHEATFAAHVLPQRPFGFRTNFHGAARASATHNIKLYGSGKISWVSSIDISTNKALVNKWKVLLAAATDGNEKYPLPIWDLNGPLVAAPGEICSETYLVVSLAASKREAKFIVAYMNTRFFRFLVSLRKVAQHNKQENFAFVPELQMDREWTDVDLYARYGITKDEIAFIESMIRPMGASDE